jgi:pimeloyl-ACP methyl ester carboxylesterase
MPDIAMNAAAYTTLFKSIHDELPQLEASLGMIKVPMGFLAGADSPLPADVATKSTAKRIPGSWTEVVEGAGHFPWYERPGSVRRALHRLVGA